jgi:microcystin-dependent protein
MGDQFLGEIRMVGFSFAPSGWALCNGQLMSISQNSALFSLLGTTFGGDGIQTFGLPDLQGRSPVGMGNGIGLTPVIQGEKSGNENASILQSQMPMHTHAVTVTGVPTNNVNAPTATNNVLGASGAGPGGATIWSTEINTPIQLNPQQVGTAGQSLPLPIRNPFLGTNFIIATEGIYPSRP